MSAIEIRNLTKYYGKQLGVKNLNLNIAEGSFYGFIGPNGAGKSTTLRLLMNMIFPSSGSAKILGKDIVKDAKDIKYFVGYLPSEINLYNGLTVAELLNRTIRYYETTNWYDKDILSNWPNSIYHLSPTERKCNMTERLGRVVNILQLDLSRKIGALSFGNMKKLGIVISIIHNPKILILDEPTGGLDPLIQEKYFDLLREKQQEGSTIFFSSHILSEVEKVCDQVAIIKDGQIIKTEGLELLKEKSLKKVVIWVKNNILDDLLKTFELNQANTDIEISKAYDGICKVTFNYTKSTNRLIEKLSAFDIQNIRIHEPTLEEVFMHYYK